MRSIRTAACRRAAWAGWTCRNVGGSGAFPGREKLPTRTTDARTPRKRYRFCNTISVTFLRRLRVDVELPSEASPPKTRNKTPLFPRNPKNPAKAGFFFASPCCDACVPWCVPRSIHTRTVWRKARVACGEHVALSRLAARPGFTVDYVLSSRTDAFGVIPSAASALVLPTVRSGRSICLS